MTANLAPSSGPQFPPVFSLEASASSACGYPLGYYWLCSGWNPNVCEAFFLAASTGQLTTYEFPILHGQWFYFTLIVCSVGPSSAESPIVCAETIERNYDGAEFWEYDTPTPGPTRTPVPDCYEYGVEAWLQPAGGTFLPGTTIPLEVITTSTCEYPETVYWWCVGTNTAACDALQAANSDGSLRAYDFPIGDNETYWIGVTVCSHGQDLRCAFRDLKVFLGQAYRSPTPTATPGPSLTPTPSPTWTPSLTPTVTHTPTQTVTPSPTSTPTETLVPSPTPTGCQENIQVFWEPLSGPQPWDLLVEWEITSACGYELEVSWTCTSPYPSACAAFVAYANGKAEGAYSYPVDYLGLYGVHTFVTLSVCSIGPTGTCTEVKRDWDQIFLPG